ncbi:hypothetical protein [Streptomyces sp. NPDC055607]
MNTWSAPHALPEEEFLERVAKAAWVGASGYRTCRVSITLARPRPTENVEKRRSGLLGIAMGMGLGKDSPTPVLLYQRLLLVKEDVSLDYGHPEVTPNISHPDLWYSRPWPTATHVSWWRSPS